MFDSKLAELCKQILTELRDNLNPPPDRVVVSPGASIVWDCFKVGLLYAQIRGGVVNSTSFTCLKTVQYQIRVGILRCVGTMDDNGKAPSAARITEDGTQIYKDAEVMQRYFSCEKSKSLAKKIGSNNFLTPQSWTPLGVSGGYAGGEWSLNYLIEDTACLCNSCR